MAELIVNTEAVLHNYRHYAENGPVIPVLKSNAYALGAMQLQALLKEQGAALFACATADEALELAGTQERILLLSCVHDTALLRKLLQCHIIISVESLPQAQAVSALQMDAHIHLAVDSGFGRFGFLPEQLDEMKQVFSLKGVHVEGIFSHFRSRAAAPEQFARFSQVLLGLSDYPVGLRHIAATHTADIAQYRLDAVRIGSGLTGCGCPELVPAAVMQARICAVRQLKKGERIGYGSTLLRRDSTVAVIDAGTADGAFTYRYRGLRAFWQQRHPYVLLGDTRVPVLCPPGLTHTMIDVTGLNCHTGDIVTVPHDLVLTDSRVPRRYTAQ